MRLDATFRSHRKVRRLARALGIAPVLARGLLVSLWTQVLAEAPDGDLEGWTPEDVADAAGVDGLTDPPEPSALVETLVDAGWLDREGEHLRIHDWEEYSAELRQARQRSRERERKRKQRGYPQPVDNSGQPVDNSCLAMSHDVPGTSRDKPGQSRDVPGTDRDTPGQTPDVPRDVGSDPSQDGGEPRLSPGTKRDSPAMSHDVPGCPADSPKCPATTGRDGTGRGRDEDGTGDHPPPGGLHAGKPADGPGEVLTLLPDEPPDHVVVSLPAKPKGATFHATEAFVDELAPCFPDVDVRACLRAIAAKCITDPKYPKTVRGWPEAIRFWLQREQDRAEKRPGFDARGRSGPSRGGRTSGNIAAAEAFLRGRGSER